MWCGCWTGGVGDRIVVWVSCVFVPSFHFLIFVYKNSLLRPKLIQDTLKCFLCSHLTLFIQFFSLYLFFLCSSLRFFYMSDTQL